MRVRVIRACALLALSALAGFWLLRGTGSAGAASARGSEPSEVTLCDGETKVPLAADAPKTPESGQKIAVRGEERLGPPFALGCADIFGREVTPPAVVHELDEPRRSRTSLPKRAPENGPGASFRRSTGARPHAGPARRASIRSARPSTSPVAGPRRRSST